MAVDRELELMTRLYRTFRNDMEDWIKYDMEPYQPHIWYTYFGNVPRATAQAWLDRGWIEHVKTGKTNVTGKIRLTPDGTEIVEGYLEAQQS